MASGSGMNECEDLHDKQVHEIFGLLVPNDDNWAGRSTVWYVFFYLMLVVYGVLFIALGLGCILLLWKRHLAQRFRLNTFIAIDLALTTLAFSRVIFLALDPWGQSEYFNCKACITVSRLLSALAFPSLTFSYTLVFITLWLSARIQLGRSCIQNLKVLIPLCCIHYIVAILFEIVGSLPVSRYPVLFLLISCEAVFAIWGLTVCFAFLLAGQRLLRSVKISARNSSVVCRDSPSMKRQDLIEKSRFQPRGTESRGRSRSTLKLKAVLREHHQRAIRKVTLITYVTAMLGIAYSIISLINLILACLNLFNDCPGYHSSSEDKLEPGIWLADTYIILILELLLALLLLYSISDFQPIIDLLYKTCCCGMKYVVTRSTPAIYSSSSPPNSSVAHEGTRDFKASKDSLDDSLTLGNRELESTIVVDSPTHSNGKTPNDNGSKLPNDNGRVKSPLTVSFSENNRVTLS